MFNSLTISCIFLFFGTLGPGSLSLSSSLYSSDLSNSLAAICFSFLLASAAAFCLCFSANNLALFSNLAFLCASFLFFSSAALLSSANLSSSIHFCLAAILASRAQSSSSHFFQRASHLASILLRLWELALEDGAGILVLFRLMSKWGFQIMRSETQSAPIYNIWILCTDQVMAFEGSGLNRKVLSRS